VNQPREKPKATAKSRNLCNVLGGSDSKKQQIQGPRTENSV
jgi:hypothetical protein